MVVMDAEKDAQRLLDIAWPSGKLPVDPVRIAKRSGLSVVEASLDPDMSGALIKALGRDPVIMLNGSDSSNRKRFSCAHELGHYVRRSRDIDSYEYRDHRASLASQGTDPEEIYANRFAAALLMPADAVRRLRHLGEVELAVRFGVSREAMQYRLQSLNLA